MWKTSELRVSCVRCSTLICVCSLPIIHQHPTVKTEERKKYDVISNKPNDVAFGFKFTSSRSRTILESTSHLHLININMRISNSVSPRNSTIIIFAENCLCNFFLFWFECLLNFHRKLSIQWLFYSRYTALLNGYDWMCGH